MVCNILCRNIRCGRFWWFGGQTPDGKDATNELSYLCLEAANQLKTTQPVMAVRTWEGTPEELIRKGCKMIQEVQANPGFFNDYAA